MNKINLFDSNLSELTPQLRISEKTYHILLSDYQFFHFASLNSLINEIVKQFQSSYSDSLLKKYKKLNEYTLNTNLSEDARENLINHFMSLDLKSDNYQNEPKSRSIKIHIQKSNSNYFYQLEQIHLDFKNTFSFSELIRDLLVKYTMLSRAERESILFAHQLSKLNDSIKKSKIVKIQLQTYRSVLFKPYEIINPLDDDGNYIYGQNENNSPDAIPLWQIKTIIIQNQSFVRDDEILFILNEIKNTQYDYRALAEYAATNIIAKVSQLKKRVKNL